MGKAIAQNIGNHGYTVSLYNKTYEKTALFIKQHPSFSGFEKLNDFVNSLEKPRKILIHINNTNPILDESNPEYKELISHGIEISYDGMSIEI